MAGLSLLQLLPEFPDVGLEKVEYLANLGSSRAAGVKAIPTLVSGDRKLTGFYLTKKKIREFLASL